MPLDLVNRITYRSNSMSRDIRLPSWKFPVAAVGFTRAQSPKSNPCNPARPVSSCCLALAASSAVPVSYFPDYKIQRKGPRNGLTAMLSIYCRLCLIYAYPSEYHLVYTYKCLTRGRLPLY